MVNDIVAASVLTLLALVVAAAIWFGWRLRQTITENIQARIEKSTARMQRGSARLNYATRKSLDAAALLVGTHEARKGARISELAERAADARARAEAALTAVAALRKIFIAAQRPYIEADAKRMATRRHPWMAFTDWVARKYRRNRWWISDAVTLATVIAVIWAIGFWIDYGNTGSHPNTTLIVCKVVTGETWWSEPKGQLNTDKGPFTLDSGLRVGGHQYTTSQSAKAGFQAGDVVVVTWHGKSLGDAYITQARIIGQGANCKTGGQITGAGAFSPRPPGLLNGSYNYVNLL